jgi:hypothetical protein
MGLKVKGNFTAGDSLISPAVKVGNSIHDKLKKAQEEKGVVIEPVTIKEELKPDPIETILHRQTPIKTFDLVPAEKYQNVIDGELIKHYNKKSLYLADMIDDTTDSG